MRKLLASFLVLVLVVGAALAPTRVAAQNVQFIRDAEIESIIRDYSTPIFKAAGLNPQAVDVYLIQDDSLNAFVAGGMNLFIHTGLLMETQGPLQIMGVIAHEAGHIAGGHLAGRRQEVERTTAQMLASYLLGLGAAVATGRPEAAAAVIRGGQDIALKGLLKYSRTQESAADQAAVRYMDQAGIPPRGMLETLQMLEGQEVLLASSQDPYLRTHPLSQDRMQALQRAVETSPHHGAPPPEGSVETFQRMRAKLIGFLRPLDKVLRAYPPEDDSLKGRYARAIAFYRRPDLEKALPLIDGLIDGHPEDAYFHELKAQMLFENGHAREALPHYQRAVELASQSALLRLGLARAQLETNDPELNDVALGHLQRVINREPQNSFAWRLMAIAHGRNGDTGMSALALAESAISRGAAREAMEQARRASRLLDKDSPGWLRAQDIQRVAQQRVQDG